MTTVGDGALAERYPALLFDLDGVLYRGAEAVPHAAETIATVRSIGTPFRFLTNNSARTPTQVADKLTALAIPAVAGDVLTSAQATGTLLGHMFPAGAVAYVIGEAGLREALIAAGIRIRESDSDRVDLVVVGWDRGVDYGKLRDACLLVQGGATLIGTNPDLSFPGPDGLWPGAGSLLGVVSSTTGVTPTVVGKPAAPMFEAAAEVLHVSMGSLPEQAPLMIGDRLDTDVAGAEGVGWDSLLVTTGTATPRHLLGSDHLPTYLSSDLTGLLRDLPLGRFRAAAPDEAASIGALLEESGLNKAGADDRVEFTVVCDRPKSSGELLATASVCDFDGFGLLRSVAVARDVRWSGLGTLAVAHALRAARGRGVRHVSLFTETAVSFFGELGFERVTRDKLPVPIRESEQARRECSESATPMVLDP